MNDTIAHRHHFIDGYIDCMLWANGFVDQDENAVLEASDRDDLSWDALKNLVRDAVGFYTAQIAPLHTAEAQGRPWDHLGHDFALTRNGHGVGYWDRELGAVGDELTTAAEAYGEAHLIKYVDVIEVM